MEPCGEVWAWWLCRGHGYCYGRGFDGRWFVWAYHVSPVLSRSIIARLPFSLLLFPFLFPPSFFSVRQKFCPKEGWRHLRTASESRESLSAVESKSSGANVDEIPRGTSSELPFRRVSHLFQRKGMLLPSLSRECGSHREEEQQSSTRQFQPFQRSKKRVLLRKGYTCRGRHHSSCLRQDSAGEHLWRLRSSTLHPTSLVGVFVLCLSLTVQGMRFRIPLFWCWRCSRR